MKIICDGCGKNVTTSHESLNAAIDSCMAIGWSFMPSYNPNQAPRMSMHCQDCATELEQKLMDEMHRAVRFEIPGPCSGGIDE